MRLRDIFIIGLAFGAIAFETLRFLLPAVEATAFVVFP